MTKVNFGCGGNILEGWINHDIEVDISKPLPYPHSTVSVILAEHVVEHVNIQEAWNFFEECFRILKPGGVARIGVPDIERIWFNWTPAYGQAVKAGGHGDETLKASIRAAIFEHGHKTAWTQALLRVVLTSIGFNPVTIRRPGCSEIPPLENVEGHWKVVGKDIAGIETSICEAFKPI